MKLRRGFDIIRLEFRWSASEKVSKRAEMPFTKSNGKSEVNLFGSGYAGLGVRQMERRLSNIVSLFFVCMYVLSPVVSGDISTGLVAHWTFDEMSGTTAFDSAGSANGILLGSTARTNGVIGGALDFNGSTDSVVISGITGYSACDEITISAWICPDNLSSYNAIYNIDAWITGSVHFQVFDDSIGLAIGGGVNHDARAFTNPNHWYHVVGVYSNANANGVTKCYVNGVEVYSEPVPQTVQINLTRAAHIGAWNTSRFFDGTIDDVRIYNRVLSEAEIGTLYDLDGDGATGGNRGDYESDGAGIAHSIQLYRMSFWRAPQDATNQSLADLAWKHGLATTGTDNKWGDPIFYQLLRDYTIELTSYFKDYTKLPDRWAKGGGGSPWTVSLRSEWWRVALYEWLVNGISDLDSRKFKIWRYRDQYDERRTMLTIKKGYRWDGPTLNWGSADNARLAAKPSASMRGSLVHDAFYDMMRTRLITYDSIAWASAPDNSVEQEGTFNRIVADCLFYMIMVQDGYETGKADSNFHTIRQFGRTRTYPDDPVNYPFWKESAIADAGPDQYIECAPPEGVDVTLDGTGSEFATKLYWIIGPTMNPDRENVGTGPSPTIHLEPGIHTISVNAYDNDDMVPLFGDTDAVVITVSTECSMEHKGDLDGDGDVDITDFALMAANWLEGVK